MDQSVFDDPDTHPFQIFFQNVNASTSLLGLNITEVFENFVAVEGDQVDTEILEQHFGTNYSCINVGAEGLEQIRDVEYHQNPVELSDDDEETEESATSFFTSELEFTSLPIGKISSRSKFRFDA